MTSCKTKDTQTSVTTPSILVQLYDATSVSVLESTYKNYSLEEQKVVSRPMNIFLFTFNSEKITDKALIEELKTSELVKEAQQNRTVQTRN